MLTWSITNGIPSKFTYDPRKFIRNDDYISPLEGLYFLPDDINRFQPAKRYISRPLLIERWAKLCDDPINAIKHRAVDSNLFEYHPISGSVESEGKLYRSGLFDLGIVKKIESTHFPRSQLITNKSVNEQTAIVKVVMNENPNPWLAADHDETLAALFVEALAKMFPTDKLYSVEQWQALALTTNITTQPQAEAAATIKTDDGDNTTTKRERAHTRWFRQIWIAEGQPPGETFFNRLKKYKNKKDSPIIDWYECSSNGPGVKIKTVTAGAKDITRKRIENMPGEFANKFKKPCQAINNPKN